MTVVSTRNSIFASWWFLTIIGLPVFVLVTLILHHSCFDGPMYYDSLGNLEGKEHIFASGDIAKVIKIFPQRPVAMATFYFNYLIWGMSPFHFRIVNVALLAVMSLIATAAFMLILETVATKGSNPRVSSQAGTGTAGPRDARANRKSLPETSEPSPQADLRAIRVVGIFLGLVFLVHPVQTYFVAYIWQRMALLSSLFYIGSLFVYLATRTHRIRFTIAGYAISVILFALALASKENAITLPAVLLLAEIAFLGTGWRSLLKRAVAFSLIVALMLIPMSYVQVPHGLPGQPSGIFTTIAKYYQESGLTPLQVAFSQCRVLFSYLALVVFPVPSNVRLAVPHVISGSPLESPATVAAVLGALALVAGAVWSLRRRPLTGFGLLFFVINLMPESFLVPQYSFFAYRAILPMFGLLLVVADLMLEVLKRIELSGHRQRYFRAIAAGALVSLVMMGTATVSRARLWHDPVLFWKDIAEGFPSDSKNMDKTVMTHTLGNLGGALQSQNRYPEAIAAVQKALSVDPLSASSFWFLGVIYDKMGEKKEAELSLKKAIEMDSSFLAAHFALGDLYMAQDRLAEAWVHMRKASDLAPGDARCLNALGMILLRQGKPVEAASYLRKAIEVSPGLEQAHSNLAEAYASMGMDADAVSQYRKCLQLKPDNWRAHNEIGLLLAKSGNSKEAIAHFRAALAQNPEYWTAHNNLGALLAESGDFEQAAAHFQEAVKLNPDAAGARKNLERIRRIKGVSR